MLDIIIAEYGGKKSRELLLHILKNQAIIMAKLSELTDSAAALTAAVAKIPTSTTTEPSVLETDLDPIKAAIDQATADINAKLPAEPTV